MRRTVLSMIIAIAPALALAAAGSGKSDSGKPAATQQSEQKKGEDPAKRLMQASPATEPEGPADPLKMATPKPSPEIKIPGAAPIDAQTYVIGAEDMLGVYAYGQKDLDLPSYLVRPDGMITVPLAGEVMAAGRTPVQLAGDISAKLEDYIQDPQVIVSVLAVHSKKYRIQGGINKPGEVDLVRPTTVLEAIANAGGFREFADKKHIKILRDGGKKILMFNYKEVEKGKRLEQNIYLEPNDIIIVKE